MENFPKVDCSMVLCVSVKRVVLTENVENEIMEILNVFESGKGVEKWEGIPKRDLTTFKVWIDPNVIAVKEKDSFDYAQALTQEGMEAEFFDAFNEGVDFQVEEIWSEEVVGDWGREANVHEIMEANKKLGLINPNC